MRKPAYMVEVNSQIFYVVRISWKFHKLNFAFKNGAGETLFIGTKKECYEQLQNAIIDNNVMNRNKKIVVAHITDEGRPISSEQKI